MNAFDRFYDEKQRLNKDMCHAQVFEGVLMIPALYSYEYTVQGDLIEFIGSYLEDNREDFTDTEMTYEDLLEIEKRIMYALDDAEIDVMNWDDYREIVHKYFDNY